MTKKNKGFTLVELLIVVAIIIVLFTIVLLILNPAELLAKSRDSKRVADLKELNKVINLAFSEDEIIWTGATGTDSCNSNPGIPGGWLVFPEQTNKTGLKKYITSLPMDPRSVSPFCYHASVDTSNQKYELRVGLEYAPNTVCQTATNPCTSRCTSTVGTPATNTSYVTSNSDGGDDSCYYEVGTNLTLL